MKYLFIFFLVGTGYVKAQDTLFFLNGSKKITKVEEVSPEHIKYRKLTNLNGPLYEVSTSEVEKIKYLNGEVDVFSDGPAKQVASAPAPKQPANGQRSNGKTKKGIDSLLMLKCNIVSLNTIDLVFMNFSMAYDYLFADGNLGVWIPATIGIDPYHTQNMSIYNSRKNYTVGLGLKWFPTGHDGDGFFVAPLFEYGEVIYNQTVYTQMPNNYGYYNLTSTTQKAKAPLYIGSLNGGFHAHLTNSLYLILYGGLGIRSQETKQSNYYQYNTNNNQTLPSVKAGFNLAFRF